MTEPAPIDPVPVYRGPRLEGWPAPPTARIVNGRVHVVVEARSYNGGPTTIVTLCGLVGKRDDATPIGTPSECGPCGVAMDGLADQTEDQTK